jgi:hypothetical protein
VARASVEAQITYAPARKTESPIRYEESIVDGDSCAAPQPAAVEATQTMEAQTADRFLLTPDHEALLQEISLHPDASTAEHYRNLNFSAGKGNRLKDALVSFGLIRSERQKCGNGRPKEILRLTDTGQQQTKENI